MYDIEQYTDEECFRILSLQDSPKDEILEKKIIEYRDKYADQKTEKTYALYNFFSSMYERFFEDSHIEGFEGNNIVVEDICGAVHTQSENLKSVLEYDSGSNLTVTRDLQYFRDNKLNPLLKETVKRTININSSDRDKVFDQMHALTTDFNFTLEETLKNVVSLKLYAIQVPFTWYTIDDAFGSNIIYLKSDTPGLQGLHHQYSFSILPGNYNPVSLTNAVNTSLQLLKVEKPMVNFGNTSLTHAPDQMKATFQLDIQKIYDTPEFKISFENDPNDNSYNNLATFLCFANKPQISFKTDTSKNYLITPRINVSSNTLTSIELVRYSARFDIAGRMIDISSHLFDQTKLNLTHLRNEESILTMIIAPEWGTDMILTTINNILATESNLSLSRVYEDDVNMIHWDINFDSYNKAPLINQKMALKINGSDTIFFPSASSKYVDLDGLPYRYVIESNSPVVPENKYNMEGMRIVMFNNTARSNNAYFSESEYKSSVDASFSLTVSNNLIITELIPNVLNQFESYHGGFSIVGQPENNIYSNSSTLKIDVSKNETYYGVEFLNDLSTETNPGIDFSGSLYSVYLFRNAGTDVSYINLEGEINPVRRITLRMSEDEIVYTSYHPTINLNAQTNANANITFFGNDNFPDFSLNVNFDSNPKQIIEKGLVLDITLSSIGTSTYNYGDIIPIPPNSNTLVSGPIVKSTLTIKIRRIFTTSDYTIYFISNVWTNALKLESSYNLYDSTGSIRGTSIDTSNKFRGISKKITISTYELSEIYGFPDIILTLPKNPSGYDLSELIAALNVLLSSNVNTFGSYFEYTGNKVRGYINITKVFTTKDYNLVFYDETSFESCNSSTNYLRAAKSNTTLGYILGFRSNTVYVLGNLVLNSTAKTDEYYNGELITNVVITLVGDSVVSVSLYNKLFIVLEDYNQNHMNDGLVSVSQRDTRASLPVYALRNIYNCNPETNEAMNQGLNGKQLTNRQIYSMNQIIEVQNQPNDQNKGTRSLKDVFAVVPIKYGLNPGDIFVEFGGTLQIQERSYFGPVNISRMRVKLLTDRGDVINLNNADWSFQIICEQLWQNI